NIETGGNEGDAEYGDLIDLLISLQNIAPIASDDLALSHGMLSVNQEEFEEPASAVTPPMTESGTLPAGAAAAESAAVPESGAPPSGSRPSVLSDSSIRVDVGLLDRLMNQVGE